MIDISKGKYHSGRNVWAAIRNNNGLPIEYDFSKSNWLLPWERDAIIRYAKSHYSDNDYYINNYESYV